MKRIIYSSANKLKCCKTLDEEIFNLECETEQECYEIIKNIDTHDLTLLTIAFKKLSRIINERTIQRLKEIIDGCDYSIKYFEMEKE